MRTIRLLIVGLVFIVGCQQKYHYTCMTDRECEIEERERIEQEQYYEEWYLDHLEGEHK